MPPLAKWSFHIAEKTERTPVGAKRGKALPLAPAGRAMHRLPRGGAR
jgi:hypothetical protein